MPDTHVRHVAAPTVEKVPDVQLTHESEPIAPSEKEAVPEAQTLQSCIPVFCWFVPALHILHALAIPAAYYPAGHAKHIVEEVEPERTEKVPAGQLAQFDEPELA